MSVAPEFTEPRRSPFGHRPEASLRYVVAAGAEHRCAVPGPGGTRTSPAPEPARDPVAEAAPLSRSSQFNVCVARAGQDPTAGRTTAHARCCAARSPLRSAPGRAGCEIRRVRTADRRSPGPTAPLSSPNVTAGGRRHRASPAARTASSPASVPAAVRRRAPPRWAASPRPRRSAPCRTRRTPPPCGRGVRGRGAGQRRPAAARRPQATVASVPVPASVSAASASAAARAAAESGRRRATHPSTLRWWARATASAPAGTSWVITEPAAV